MRKKPQQPKLLITVALAGIAVVATSGILIAFAINRLQQVTPEESAATEICCSCNWTIQTEDGTTIDLGTTGGMIQDGSCVFQEPSLPLGNHTPRRCSENITAADVFGDSLPAGITAETPIQKQEHAGACKGGGISNTSTPLLPSDQSEADDSEVSFTSVFEVYTKEDSTKTITDAELIFEYPATQVSPNPVTTDKIELVETRQAEGDLIVNVYKATFSTTWDVVRNSEKSGLYMVKFRGQDSRGEWTDPTTCTRTFAYSLESLMGEYCYSLDAVPVNGISPLEVTLTVDAGVPESDDTARFQWSLDLNCNGSIEANLTGTEAEVFTTPVDTPSITRTFAHSGTEDTQTCQAGVVVLTGEGEGTALQELNEGSCSNRTITLSSTAPTCGNGSCDPGETCDTNGNLSCPSEQPLSAGTTCRQDCTYCGDGIINGGEECDPAIGAGETGYDAQCDTACRTSTGDPDTSAGTDDEDDETPAEGTDIPAGTIVVTQQTPTCLEVVSPNNSSTITITVTNNHDETVLIRAVSDTLPQGLAYSVGSSVINGTSNSNDSGIVIETSGSSQMVTWTNSGNGWNVPSGSTLGITFTTSAGSLATMGSHSNSVTVTPANGNPIPSTGSLLVAQTCSQPNTGIFDRNIVAILIGSLLLIVAATAYYTGFGTEAAARLFENSAQALKTAAFRLSLPQKYMEEQVQKTALKKVLEHTDETKNGRKKRKK